MDDDEKRTSTHPVLLLSYPLTPVFPVHYFPSAITWTVGSLALGQGIAIKGLTENAVVARREMCTMCISLYIPTALLVTRWYSTSEIMYEYLLFAGSECACALDREVHAHPLWNAKYLE